MASARLVGTRDHGSGPALRIAVLPTLPALALPVAAAGAVFGTGQEMPGPKLRRAFAGRVAPRGG